MSVIVHRTLAALAVVIVTSTPARADWLLTPFAGVTFGGGTSTEHVTFGGSLAWMGAGIVGFELDAGYTPDALDDDGLGLFDSNVATLMGNLIVGAPLGEPGVRPYASGGVGLIRTRISDADDFFEIDDNSFGVNVGAGIVGFVGDHVGIRGDLRYFRSVNDQNDGAGIDLDLGTVDFWRGTVGVTFRF